MIGNYQLLVVVAIVTTILVPEYGQSARILTVFPMVSKSHFAVGEGLTVGLARAGHHVTLISPYNYKPPVDVGNLLESIELTGLVDVAKGKLKCPNRKYPFSYQ